jgi:tetratricopeptide (TPR) repeat protein
MGKKNMDFIPVRHVKKSPNLIIRRVVNTEHKFLRHFRRLYKPRMLLIFGIILASLCVIAFAGYHLYFREKWVEMNYKWGLENLASGKFDKAAKNFETATSGKNEADAMYRLAVSKYNQKDYPGAIEAYQRVIEKDPQNAAAYNGLGNLYRDEKNYEVAKDYYKKAVEASHSYVISYSNWAIMLLDMGKNEEAKKVILEGAKSNPGSTELMNLKKIIDEEQ